MVTVQRAASIALVINSLEGGGAERVMSTLAPRLASRGRTVRLVTLDHVADRYVLPPPIARRRLASRGGLVGSVKALFALAREERPDVLVSFLTRANIAAILCGRALGIPCIVSERVHTSTHLASRRFAATHRLAVRLTYPRADRIIAVSDGVKDDLVTNFGIARNRIETIHNSIDTMALRKEATAPPGLELPDSFAVAAGRLVASKNFAMLVRAFAAAGVPGHLVILGEGPERPHLEATVRRLGMQDRILLPGHAVNPHAVFARARLYVSSSNAEGFPNALVEAMALGCPAISTDCPAGPAEILGRDTSRPGIGGIRIAPFGVLVPTNDVFAMAAALRAMGDETFAMALAQRAERRVLEFGVGSTIARWEAAIDHVLTERNGRSA